MFELTERWADVEKAYFSHHFWDRFLDGCLDLFLERFSKDFGSPKMIPKWVQDLNQSLEMGSIQKWIVNGIPRWCQNGSKMYPKSGPKWDLHQNVTIIKQSCKNIIWYLLNMHVLTISSLPKHLPNCIQNCIQKGFLK